VVIVDHSSSGYQTIYAHLGKTIVAAGATVEGGQLVGYVGSTGRSTGPHLHYEVRFHGKPVNPVPFILPDGAVSD
jgi:murein DD-endopeptidase MepM/ murein hydrolase activator NlpD